MTQEVSSDHKDFITLWEVSNLPAMNSEEDFSEKLLLEL